MDLNNAVIFAKIVEQKGISAAARWMNMPKSKVSRRLSELEQSLGTQLIARSTRSMHLTEAGEVFYQHAKRIVDESEYAKHSLSGLIDTPRGRLRVNTSHSLGQYLISPHLGEFLERYPEVQVEMQLDNRRVDIIEENFDFAIRVGKLDDSNLIARYLGTSKAGLFASPSYIEKYGTPSKPEELSSHRCLAMNQSSYNSDWALVKQTNVKKVPINPHVIINDFRSLIDIARSNIGLIFVPEYLVINEVEAGELQPILQEWHSEPFLFHAMYAGRRSMTQKLRVFLDFYIEKFKQKGLSK